jgi:predicted DNA binding protein
MSLFVTVSLELPILETAIEAAPDVDITIEQQMMTGDSTLDLTMWASGERLDLFEEGLDDDETVTRWVTIGGADTQKLYRTRLTERASARVNCNGWTDGKAVLLSARRRRSGWIMDAFFRDRAGLQSFVKGCEANDVSADLLRVSDVDQLRSAQKFGLTELQSETLREAFDRGLYSVPRKVNLEGLAESLDVSHQALSERLRRGVNSLIEHTIAAQSGSEVSRTTVEKTSSPDITAQNVTL